MEVSCVWLSSWVGLRIIYIICISAVWSTSRQLTCLQRLYCETSDSGPVKLADAWMGDAIQNYRIPCCQKKKKKRPFCLFVSGLYTGFILTFGTATDYCSHPMVAFSLHARTLVERSTIHSLWTLFFFKVEILLVHSYSTLYVNGSVGWDDCGQMFHDELCVSLCLDKFAHYAWTVS